MPNVAPTKTNLLRLRHELEFDQDHGQIVQKVAPPELVEVDDADVFAGQQEVVEVQIGVEQTNNIRRLGLRGEISQHPVDGGVKQRGGRLAQADRMVVDPAPVCGNQCLIVAVLGPEARFQPGAAERTRGLMQGADCPADPSHDCGRQSPRRGLTLDPVEQTGHAASGFGFECGHQLTGAIATRARRGHSAVFSQVGEETQFVLRHPILSAQFLEEEPELLVECFRVHTF